MIPPEQNSSFVASMEMVLDVYKRPFDPRNPVVCMDESPKQLIAETRIPVPCSPGKPAIYDYGYKRKGMCNIFLSCEPLTGKIVVTGQCLKRRMNNIEAVKNEVIAWQISETIKFKD